MHAFSPAGITSFTPFCLEAIDILLKHVEEGKKKFEVAVGEFELRFDDAK